MDIKKRAYGDILGILEITDEKGNTRYVEVPNIIPQGGDGLGQQLTKNIL